MIAGRPDPTAASVVFVRPIMTWVRAHRRDPDGTRGDVPGPIAERAAKAPLALAVFSLLAWRLVTAFAFVRFRVNVQAIPPGLGVHMIVRPVLAGFIAGTATFFARAGRPEKPFGSPRSLGSLGACLPTT